VHKGGALEIEYENLTVVRGGRVVISGLTMNMKGPGLYQVIGPNGAGKTTLLLATMGVLKPAAGRISIRPWGSASGVVAYVPQSFELPEEAPVSTYEFVENYLLLWAKKRGVGVDVEERARKALELVGIPRSLWSERLTRLSGGTMRRALIARALVTDAPIMLLDEPFSNIDPEGRVEVAELLGELSSSKLLVVTSHDPVLLLSYTKELLLLGYGRHEHGPPSEIVKYEVLSRFYKKCAIEVEKHVHIADWH
jgi:zinc/manganese transport system ATP-binding protein